MTRVSPARLAAMVRVFRNSIAESSVEIIGDDQDIDASVSDALRAVLAVPEPAPDGDVMVIRAAVGGDAPRRRTMSDTKAGLIAWADKIDNRLGPISGREADALAVAVRAAADRIDMLKTAVRAAADRIDMLKTAVRAAADRIDALETVLRNAARNDKTVYKHHEARPWNGEKPGVSDGTIWLTPAEMARAILDDPDLATARDVL